jgi:hypothetical protein
MDFKLNIMKKIIILTVLLFLSSCNKNCYPKFNYNYSINPWIECFKDQVFFSSLRESYKNNPILFKLIEERDALNPYDGLTLVELEMAKNLGIDLVKKIPPPSMCEDCKEGDNYYMANCLHYYASSQLDSLAKEKYKEHLKMKKLNVK